MTSTRRFFVLAMILVAAPQAARAQILDTRLRTATTSPTTDQLLERIVALEARVARLESLLSVVNGTVVLDGRGAPVLLKGSSIKVQSDLNFELRAGNTIAVESSAAMALKGFTISFNNGTKPALCAGAVTTAVPVIDKQHYHQVLGQGCGTSVLVP